MYICTTWPDLTLGHFCPSGKPWNAKLFYCFCRTVKVVQSKTTGRTSELEKKVWHFANTSSAWPMAAICKWSQSKFIKFIDLCQFPSTSTVSDFSRPQGPALPCAGSCGGQWAKGEFPLPSYQWSYPDTLGLGDIDDKTGQEADGQTVW